MSLDAALNDAVTNLDDRSLLNDVDGHVLQSFLEAQQASFAIVVLVLLALLWLQFPRLSLGTMIQFTYFNPTAWARLVFSVASIVQGEHRNLLVCHTIFRDSAASDCTSIRQNSFGFLSTNFLAVRSCGFFGY